MVEPQRIVELNDAPEQRGDYVLYWMQQSQRAAHNPALEVAVAAADRLALPVLVCFGLTEAVPEANLRHYAFMLEGLAETAAQLRRRGIGFVLRRGAPEEVALALGVRAALIVCDRGYLRWQQAARSRLIAAAACRVVQVEGDVVVPVVHASQRREVGARTLRPRIAAQLSTYLKPLRERRPRIAAAHAALPAGESLADLPALLAGLRVERGIAPVSAFHGGYSHARRRLKEFIATRLAHYSEARRRPGVPRVSTLSPYLHFGQISPVEVALAVRAAAAPRAERDGFLEELIVRRELAVNFVHTTAGYDRYEALPEWARRSLDAHRGDPRPHKYAYDELAAAATHDPYWNAAMREMLTTGFMHNYLRMYWGKKVLEWCASPEEAHACLLRLNNAWFLDGRDPSSYANVGWIFGLHDRPWPERPVFGNVRYMSADGLRRKCDIDEYVRRVDAMAGPAPFRLE